LDNCQAAALPRSNASGEVAKAMMPNKRIEAAILAMNGLATIRRQKV